MNGEKNIEALASQALAVCRQAGIMLATAESCTGGMIAASLTSVAGSSDVFDRGFVTYSNEAKAEMLGVPLAHTIDPGAVSALVAQEMVAGALENSAASIAIAVTGIAGPDGGSVEKPVGLVYIAGGLKGGSTTIEECCFGDLGRSGIRDATIVRALEMVIAQATKY